MNIETEMKLVEILSQWTEDWKKQKKCNKVTAESVELLCVAVVALSDRVKDLEKRLDSLFICE